MYQMNVEAAGAQFFNYKDYRKASGEYYSHFHEYLMQGINASVKGEQAGQFATNSLTGGLMVHFDILQSQDELADMAGGPERSKLHRLKFFTDSAYAMQHIGGDTDRTEVIESIKKESESNNRGLTTDVLVEMEKKQRTGGMQTIGINSINNTEANDMDNAEMLKLYKEQQASKNRTNNNSEKKCDIT